MREFAAAEGMAAATLYWWRSKLRRDDRDDARLVPVEFVDRCADDAPALGGFELQVDGVMTLRVPAGFDEGEASKPGSARDRRRGLRLDPVWWPLGRLLPARRCALPADGLRLGGEGPGVQAPARVGARLRQADGVRGAAGAGRRAVKSARRRQHAARGGAGEADGCRSA